MSDIDNTTPNQDTNTSNSNKIEEDYNFQFKVASYEKTIINKETIIQFTITLHSDITNTSWTITRTSFVIDDYINSLFQDGLLSKSPLPKLRFISDVYLGTYTVLLNDYLHQLTTEEHIINSFHTRHFFELEDNHIKSIANYHKSQLTLSPLTKSQLQSNNRIVDVLFSSYENFLYVSLAYDTPSLLSKLFFSSSPNDQYQGAIEIYNIVKGDNVFEIEKIETVKLESRPVIMKYVKMDNNEFNLLFIGTEDGSIETYQTYNNFNVYLSKTIIEHLSHLSVSSSSSHSLIDFGIDKNSGYVYSVSLNERQITISEFNYQTIISRINIDFFVSLFCFDNENHKIFIADNEGNLYIYQIDKLINLTLLQAIYSDEVLGSNTAPIDKLWIESDRNFLFFSKSHTVLFYDFAEKDNFQFEIFKRLSVRTFHQRDVTGIQYRNNKGELILGTANGFVEFWSHDYKLPVLLFKAHNGLVSKVIYDKVKGYLITIGIEGKVKLWTLPEQWASEGMRRDSFKNSFSIIEGSTQNTNNIALLKDVFSKMSFGSSGGSFRKISEDEIIRFSSNRKLSSGKEIVTPMTDSTENNVNSNNINDESNNESNEGSDLDGWDVDVDAR